MSVHAIYKKMRVAQVNRERRIYKVVDTFFDTWIPGMNSRLTG